MDLPPNDQFQICVDRCHGNRYVKNFSCGDQFLSLAIAPLSCRESLRDIEACLRGRIPTNVYVTGGQVPDVNILDQLLPEAGAF